MRFIKWPQADACNINHSVLKNLTKKKPTLDRAVFRVGPIMKNKQNKHCKYTMYFQSCQQILGFF
ncbi:MAG: hypothetical protein CVT99_05190 [Bacteroidetes bacterium HGW-Bacteroidetes-16]|nr:MAG: hypothetical protein CVT99_05190 [Bacteroidetes bacterium HGW-Bacteroidetes-16]